MELLLIALILFVGMIASWLTLPGSTSTSTAQAPAESGSRASTQQQLA